MSVRKEGFTLLELLIAIAIIGIFSGVVIVSLSDSSDEAKKTLAVVHRQELQKQINLDLALDTDPEELARTIFNFLGEVKFSKNERTIVDQTIAELKVHDFNKEETRKAIKSLALAGTILDADINNVYDNPPPSVSKTSDLSDESLARLEPRFLAGDEEEGGSGGMNDGGSGGAPPIGGAPPSFADLAGSLTVDVQQARIYFTTCGAGEDLYNTGHGGSSCTLDDSRHLDTESVRDDVLEYEDGGRRTATLRRMRYRIDPRDQLIFNIVSELGNSFRFSSWLNDPQGGEGASIYLVTESWVEELDLDELPPGSVLRAGDGFLTIDSGAVFSGMRDHLTELRNPGVALLLIIAGSGQKSNVASHFGLDSS